MKKALLALIIVVILNLMLQSIGPWWLIAFIAFFVCTIISVKPGQAFIFIFLAGFTMWMGQAAYASHLNDGILANKIGQLFGGVSGGMLTVLGGVIGGLLAGMGGLSGSLLRKKIDRNSKK